MRTGDEAQRKRIRHAPADARLLVEAGPGTGKTEMAAVRMAGLVRKGLAPGQLLVLSFSRSAVRNLTDRLARLEGTDDSIIEELRHVSIRTFDSWAFRMLRLLRNPLDALLARGHDDNIEKLTALFGGRRREEIRELIGDRRHLIVDEFQDLGDVSRGIGAGHWRAGGDWRGTVLRGLGSGWWRPRLAGRGQCRRIDLADGVQAVADRLDGEGTHRPSYRACHRLAVDDQCHRAQLTQLICGVNPSGQRVPGPGCGWRGALDDSRQEDVVEQVQRHVTLAPAPPATPSAVARARTAASCSKTTRTRRLRIVATPGVSAMSWSLDDVSEGVSARSSGPTSRNTPAMPSIWASATPAGSASRSRIRRAKAGASRGNAGVLAPRPATRPGRRRSLCRSARSRVIVSVVGIIRASWSSAGAVGNRALCGFQAPVGAVFASMGVVASTAPRGAPAALLGPGKARTQAPGGVRPVPAGFA